MTEKKIPECQEFRDLDLERRVKGIPAGGKQMFEALRSMAWSWLGHDREKGVNSREGQFV